MSVDLYVALPADNWPTAEQVQQCVMTQGFPVEIQRLPSFDPGRVATDGALVVLDGSSPAYLEGEVFSSGTAPDDVATLNDRLVAVDSPQIATSHAVMSFRTRSNAEMRAASYIVASFIICFDGFGFEPQGNTGGRHPFAQELLTGADYLKGL